MRKTGVKKKCSEAVITVITEWIIRQQVGYTLPYKPTVKVYVLGRRFHLCNEHFSFVIVYVGYHDLSSYTQKVTSKHKNRIIPNVSRKTCQF